MHRSFIVEHGSNPPPAGGSWSHSSRVVNCQRLECPDDPLQNRSDRCALLPWQDAQGIGRYSSERGIFFMNVVVISFSTSWCSQLPVDYNDERRFVFVTILL